MQNPSKPVELLNRKNIDYNNIAGGRDSYFPFGHKSYLQMLHVKMSRLLSLENNADNNIEVQFESRMDSVVDLINYAQFYKEYLEKL